MPRDAVAERYHALSGLELERYARTAADLILSARLNRWYPDPFGCADIFSCLAPSVHGGVYASVLVDQRNGMPRLKDVAAVRADREIAEDFLRKHLGPSSRQPSAKLAAKLEYYGRLATLSIPPLFQLSLKLRRVFPERAAAAFEAVFDRFDISEGVFVRYTVLLEQSDSMWGGGGLLARSGDYSRQTASFRESMERFAQSESEIMFLLLGKLEGVRVEEVSRGRIGPLWSPWAKSPKGWMPDSQDSFVLHCPLDRASTGHEVDLDNDPFSTLYRDFLSDRARPVIDEAAALHGYRVHKERKFACTPSALKLLREKLGEAGTKNAVYSI